MDNDMLPNDGELFNAFMEPEDQAEERRKSISKAQAAKPFIEDQIAMYQADIDQLNTVSAIPVDYDTQPEEFRTAWLIRQEMIKYAQDKKLYLESLLVTTKR